MLDKDLAFCEQCHKTVKVDLVEELEELELDGTAYTYPVRHGVCPECGGIATPNSVLDENQRSFTDAVRAANGIVGQDVVESVPERYSIGRRPLSRLLGWGEHTYSRFIEGDVPSAEYSRTIKRIARSPLAFLLKLYGGRDELSGVAFKKSRDATLLVLKEFGRKIECAAAYILGRTGSVSPLALQKELYYADGLCLSYDGGPLFSERCEAWAHGPVFPRLWADADLRDVAEDSLFGDEVADYMAGRFSDKELEVLDAVVGSVARFSPYVLRSLTHKESPWADARAGVGDGEPSRNEITVESMRRFFGGLWERYGMERPEDISRYMNEAVLRIEIIPRRAD